LGLRLQATKGSAEVLVVDRIERRASDTQLSHVVVD